MEGEEVARVKVELFDDSESNRNDDDVLSESKDSRVTMEEVTMRTMAHAVKEEMDDDIVNLVVIIRVPNARKEFIHVHGS